MPFFFAMLIEMKANRILNIRRQIMNCNKSSLYTIIDEIIFKQRRKKIG